MLIVFSIIFYCYCGDKSFHTTGTKHYYYPRENILENKQNNIKNENFHLERTRTRYSVQAFFPSTCAVDVDTGG